MKVLLTAFDPFGGDKVNPAEEAVKLVRQDIPGVTLTKLSVPTVFYRSLAVLKEALQREQYDACLCVGQAGGRYDMTLERVAINLDDARITDNDGQQPIDTAIIEDGPLAYLATLPIKTMVQAVRDGGIPASVSNSAGTFVCNHLMYGALHYASLYQKNCRAGFMHVPFIPAQVLARPNAPAMSLSDITRAIELALASLPGAQADLKITGGAIC